MKFKLEVELEIDDTELLEIINYDFDLSLEEVLELPIEVIVKSLNDYNWIQEEIEWFGVDNMKITKINEKNQIMKIMQQLL